MERNKSKNEWMSMEICYPKYNNNNKLSEISQHGSKKGRMYACLITTLMR